MYCKRKTGNRPIKPNGLSLTRVLIFAARGAAVKHFYVCARDVAKSPPTATKIIHSEERASERTSEHARFMQIPLMNIIRHERMAGARARYQRRIEY